MFEIIKTETFERWIRGLRDRQAIARINARLRRVLEGNLGDVKVLRDGVSELRVDYGPGYRVYFMRSGPLVIVLLAGGDKRTRMRISNAPWISQQTGRSEYGGEIFPLGCSGLPRIR